MIAAKQRQISHWKQIAVGAVVLGFALAGAGLAQDYYCKVNCAELMYVGDENGEPCNHFDPAQSFLGMYHSHLGGGASQLKSPAETVTVHYQAACIDKCYNVGDGIWKEQQSISSLPGPVTGTQPRFICVGD